MRSSTAVPGPIALLVVSALAGCFSLSRDTPRLAQFVLGGAPQSEPVASPSRLDGIAIGLRRLDLAMYLATTAVVVRRGAHELVISEYHRWGEDPAEGINRAVAEYLGAGRPGRTVDVAPWPLRSRYDYLVQLHISRFEGVATEDSAAAQGEAHMLATWEILRHSDGAVLARGTTNYVEPGWRVGDYTALVMLLDGGLRALSNDLKTCFGRLFPIQTPTTVQVEAVSDPEPVSVQTCGDPSE